MLFYVLPFETTKAEAGFLGQQKVEIVELLPTENSKVVSVPPCFKHGVKEALTFPVFPLSTSMRSVLKGVSASLSELTPSSIAEVAENWTNPQTLIPSMLPPSCTLHFELSVI